MKFLIDMNLSPLWVAMLTSAGLEAMHWSTVGKKTALDKDIMTFAGQNGYTVITHDLDFSAILAATRGLKPSVIQIRAERTAPEFIGVQVVTAIRQMETELRSGALLTIDPKRTRLRVLPLL
ncbi:MAG: DUF5615 family PIN-like protein [Gammaproteobacteria bacterium]|nr:DUF5615 family PIN-like protein [Gammaproteobacteria bacterium]